MQIIIKGSSKEMAAFLSAIESQSIKQSEMVAEEVAGKIKQVYEKQIPIVWSKER